MDLRSIQLSPRARIVAAVIVLVLPALIYWQVWGFARVTKDTGEFLDNARDIANFRLPSDPDRPPLASVPALLTGVTTEDSDSHWLLLLQLLMHGVVVLIASYTILDLGPPILAAVGTAALLWLPPYVDHAGYIMSESPTEFCLAIAWLGLYSFLKNRSIAALWLGSSFSALTALVRPTFQLLSPLLAAVLILLILPGRSNTGSAKRISAPKTLAIFVLPFVIFVLGWCGLNYARFGFFGMSAKLGYELTSRTVKVIERLPESERQFRETLIKHRDSDLVEPHHSHNGLCYIGKAMRELPEVTGKTRAEVLQDLVRMNLWLILHAPSHYLEAVGQGSVTYWMPGAGELSSGESRLGQLLWTALQLLVNVLFIFLPLIIAAKLAFNARSYIPGRATQFLRHITVLALTMILYNWLISCAISTGDARFRVPTDFLIVLTVVIFLFSGAQEWTFRRYRPAEESALTGIPT